MKKIEVLASSLKFTAVGEHKPTVLVRNDHFPTSKINPDNLKLMIKNKLVKYVDEEGHTVAVEKTKPVKAPKDKEVELVTETESTVTDQEAKDGEF